MPGQPLATSYLTTMLAEGPPTFSARTAAGPEIRFVIKRLVLQLLLERAYTVVPNRDVMPVLKHVQIQALPGQLRVIGSDSDLSIIAATELVDVSLPGVAVLPARRLLDIVREAHNTDVTIHITGLAAVISIGPTRWNLTLVGGQDFPAMPEIADLTVTTVDLRTFVAALHAVQYAACRDNVRNTLMMVEVRGGRMIASDGARFQQVPVPDLPFPLHIPIAAVDDLLKLARTTEAETIAVGEAHHHLVFQLGRDVFLVKKLEGNFPDMTTQLLRPALANRRELRVARTDLTAAVRRVRIAADTNTHALALIIAGDSLTVAAKDRFANDASETIPIDGWTGPDHTVIVNHQYLSDMIDRSGAETLHFYLGEDTRQRKAPLLLRGTDGESCGVVQQMIGDWMR